jgi:O-antigen/teichoic acid export membrane protein
MKKYLHKIWHFSLPIIFLIVFIHFLKDITQDILKVPSFLDLLGNVNEDLSVFPLIARQIINALGFVSFGTEAFLIVAIPKVMKNKENSKLEKYVIASLLFLIIYFISVTLMDPCYHL